MPEEIPRLADYESVDRWTLALPDDLLTQVLNIADESDPRTEPILASLFENAEELQDKLKAEAWGNGDMWSGMTARLQAAHGNSESIRLRRLLLSLHLTDGKHERQAGLAAKLCGDLEFIFSRTSMPTAAKEYLETRTVRILSRSIDAALRENHSLAPVLLGAKPDASEKYLCLPPGYQIELDRLLAAGRLSGNELFELRRDVTSPAGRAHFDAAVERNWSALEARLKNGLIALLELRFGNSPSEYVEAFPRAACEPAWLAAILLEIRRRVLFTDRLENERAAMWGAAMAKFNAWTPSHLESLIDTLDGQRSYIPPLRDALFQAVRMLWETSPADGFYGALALLHLLSWVQASSRLWADLDLLDEARAFVRSLPDGGKAIELMDRFGDLPFGLQGERPAWNRLDQYAKERWCGVTYKKSAGQPPIREALVSFMLRFASRGLYADLEPLLITLIETEAEVSRLETLAAPEVGLVALRASALLWRLRMDTAIRNQARAQMTRHQ